MVGCALARLPLKAVVLVMCWGALLAGAVGGCASKTNKSAPKAMPLPELQGFWQVAATTTMPRATPDPARKAGGSFQLFAGETHTCAQRSDGQMFCWGANALGQAGQTRREPPYVNIAQPNAMGQVEGRFVAGSKATCVLRPDGSIGCWGMPYWPKANLHETASLENILGQMNQGEANLNGMTTIRGLGPVEAMTIGESFLCGVKDAEVLCWGSDQEGQRATGRKRWSFLPGEEQQALMFWGKTSKIVGLAGIVALSSSDQGICALDDQSAVWCWGGVPSSEPVPDGPTRVELEEPVVGIVSAGQRHCAIFKGRQKMACWSQWPLGEGVQTFAIPQGREPHQLALGRSNAAVDSPHLVCGVDGLRKVWCMDTDNGELQQGAWSELEGVVSLSFGRAHQCASLLDGRILCKGANASFQLGNGSVASSQTFVEVLFPLECPDGAVVTDNRCELDGVPHGPFRVFWPRGVLKATGSYNKGKKEGFWQDFDRYGKVSQSGHYSADVREGAWKLLEGGICYRVTYEEGVLHGPWSRSNCRTDEVEISGQMHRGVPDGQWRVRFADMGKDLGARFDKGVQQTWTHFEPGFSSTFVPHPKGYKRIDVLEGEPGVRRTTVHQTSQSLPTWDYTNTFSLELPSDIFMGQKEVLEGSLRREFWLGLLSPSSSEPPCVGAILVETLAGQVLVEAPCVNGKVEGTIERFNADGKLVERSTYKADRLVGLQTTWHPNGAKAAERQHPKGLRRTWHPNGQLFEEGAMMPHKHLGFVPTGPHKTWYPNGQLRSQAVFETEAVYNTCVEDMFNTWSINPASACLREPDRQDKAMVRCWLAICDAKPGWQLWDWDGQKVTSPPNQSMRDFVRAKANDFSLEIFTQQGGKPVLDAKRTAHFASGVGKEALAACLSQEFKGKVHNRETLGSWWMTFDHVAKAGQWTVSGETPSLEDLGNRPGHGLISRQRWALVGGDGKALSKAFGQCITQKALGTLDVPNDAKAKFSARLTAWSPY